MAGNEFSVIALCEKSTINLVVLKIFNPKSADRTLLYTDTLMNISLVHQNIMRTHHFIKNLNIVTMEYVNLGPMSKFIIQNQKILNEKFCFLLIMQIIECIEYMHNTRKISFKFLSIDKFLLNDLFLVKLTEMNTFNIGKKNETVFNAPEIKINEILQKKTDYFKSDIYSLGVIFQFILTREYPKKKFVKSNNSVYFFVNLVF